MTTATPPTAEGHLQGGDEKVDLERWLGEATVALRRHRGLFRAVFLSALGAALVAYLITPRRYQATTLLLIERTETTPVNLEDLFELDPAGSEYYQTQYRLLESRGLAEQVVLNLDLAQDPVFNPPRAAWLFWMSDPPADDAVALGRLAARLLEDVEVDPVNRTHMVEVSYLAPNPELAARVANGFADAFIEWGASRRVSAVGQASSFLASQVAALRQEVIEKESQLQDYSRSSDIIALDPQSNVVIQRLEALNRDYARAVSERIAREARHREFTTTRPEAIAETFAPGLIAQLRGEQARLEREYANKLTTFKPEWPAMQELKAQIDESKANLDAMIAGTVAKAREAARTEYHTALRREQSLADELARQKEQAMGLNSAAVEYNNLKVEVSARRGLLDELLRRQSETEVASRLQGARTADVTVVDVALAPQKPHRPSLPLNLGLGLAIGLLAGVSSALLAEHLDRTIRSPDEVAPLMRLPLLGAIPDSTAVGSDAGYGPYGRQSPRPRRRDQGTTETEIELLPYRAFRSTIAESYRSFRTSLLLSTAEELRSILITSGQPGEGKSTTVANLAVVMSQLGRRVLVVDADLRRPRQHSIFGIPNGDGLVGFLTAGLSLEDCVVETRIPNLSLVTAGRLPPNPAELLSSRRMRSFVQELATAGYDTAIFDSPPALVVTDAPLLGSILDGVVICLRAGVVDRSSAIACRARLQLPNARLLGVLLNGLRPDGRSTGEYSYYAYRHPDARGGAGSAA